MRIVLMGPPGAGKGTQAKLLAERYGMAHLSSGDLFRAEAASGSPLGQELSGYMKAGQLVPDATVVAVMAKAVAASRAPGGLLLDGFPRTVAQAQALDEQLERAGKPLDAVVLLEAGDDLIVERLAGRRVHPRTGRIYHVKNMPPKVPGIDDETSEKLIQREDDREEVVRNRLDVYRRQTEPVVAYYRSRGRLPVVQADSTQPPQTVLEALEKAFAGLDGRK